jgi:hypothetical protein
MPISLGSLKPFSLNSKVFVETGSYMGAGIRTALEAGFEQVYSIEITDYYFNLCTGMFASDKRVHIIKGDSATQLESLICTINEPITYWLDGHYSGGRTGIGKVQFPLLYEIDTIADFNLINYPNILIDDIRCFSKQNPDIGYDVGDICKKLREVYTSYYIDLDGDILRAYKGE